MKTLLYAFWKICLLRANPQDLPSSPFLLGLSLAGYGVAGIIDSTVEMPFIQAMLATLVDIVMLAGLIYVALWMRVLTTRYIQTLTALTGTGALFGMMAFLPAVWQHALAAGETTLTLPGLLLLIIILWNVVVMAHILRHALSAWMIFGLAIAMMYAFLSIRLIEVLFHATG